MKGSRLAIAVLAGLACFAAGVLSARFFGGAKEATPPMEPRIVVDPATINLLPDASLRLDLPPGFDAGLADR